MGEMKLCSKILPCLTTFQYVVYVWQYFFISFLFFILKMCWSYYIKRDQPSPAGGSSLAVNDISLEVCSLLNVLWFRSNTDCYRCGGNI